MKIEAIRVEIPEGGNIILGQTHFIKTAEDLYEIVATTVPQAHFGIAFTEASGPCLIRTEGNDEELVRKVHYHRGENRSRSCVLHPFAERISHQHSNQVKNCPEVCRIFCATANPLEVLVTGTAQGRGVVGVVDGFPPKGVETEQDRDQRKSLLRKIGYKL